MLTRSCWRPILCLCALVTAPACGRAPRAAPAMAASVVYRDPVTGRLGAPPPGLIIGPVTPRPRPPLVDQPGPRGGRLILLDDRFDQRMIVSRASDGALRGACGSGATP